MPLNQLETSLTAASADWGSSACVILVDEDTGDSDESKDREAAHTAQATVLKHAVKCGFGVYIVAFGGASTTGTFQSNLGSVLNDAIPLDTKVYYKAPTETDGFVNGQLGKDIAAAKHTRAIIMGQSRNACCAKTAASAAKAGLTVHTAPALTRGGGVTTKDFFYLTTGGIDWGWPDGTNIHASI